MLNSLEIKNFRLLESFQVKKLGQVNLVVGKNNSGKSSVLEALRIYAGSANRGLLESIAQGHNEKYRLNEDDEQNAFDTILPFEDFFTGRKFPENDGGIVIGEIGDAENSLNITHGFLVEEEETTTDEQGEETTRIRRITIDKSELSDLEYPAKDVLIIAKEKQVFIVDFARSGIHSRRFATEINSVPCSVIPTQFIS